MNGLTEVVASQNEAAEECIAKYIHDEVLGPLAALRMGLASLGPARAEALIDSAIAAGRAAETRLRQPEIEFGLHSTIEYELRSFQKMTGVITSLTIDPEHLPADSRLGTGLFRVIRGVLSLVQGARSSTSVVVSSSEGDLGKSISISDTAPSVQNPETLSIGAQQREWLEWLASAFGAEVVITGSPGRGGTVQILLPTESP